MDNIVSSDNLASQEKVSKKFPLLKMLIPLAILLVLGVLGFVFRGRILNLISPDFLVNEVEIIDETVNSDQGPFGSFIKDNSENYPKDGQFMGRIGEFSFLVLSRTEGGKTFLNYIKKFRKNPQINGQVKICPQI